MKKFVYIAAMLTLGLNQNALAADVSTNASSEEKIKYKDDGGYKDTRHIEQTTSDGTKHSADASVNVDIDSNGLATKTVKTKNVDDPVGLMNKRTDTTNSVTKQRAGGGFDEKVSHKYTDASGAKVDEEAINNVSIDTNGDVREKAKSVKTVNPKGIFNKKTTSTTQVEAVNGRIVKQNGKEE